MGEQVNQHKSPPHLSPRLGALKGQFSVPEDFDRMGQEQLADLFEGIAEH